MIFFRPFCLIPLGLSLARFLLLIVLDAVKNMWALISESYLSLSKIHFISLKRMNKKKNHDSLQRAGKLNSLIMIEHHDP